MGKIGKIAILSDIHGNSMALSAVLVQIKKQEIDSALILGDFIGYYHRPREVMDMLMGSGLHITAVRGNHEQMLSEILQGQKNWSDINTKYGHGLWLAYNLLSTNALEALLGLPIDEKMTLGKYKISLSHEATMAGKSYVYPDSNYDDIDFSTYNADIIMMGHTHYPMIGIVQGRLLVNPGSVGQSRRYGGVAEWAVLHTETGMVVPQYTPYDVQAVMDDCHLYDENVSYLIEVLQRRWR